MRTDTRLVKFSLILIAVLMSSGCYTFRPQSEALVKSVAVLTFENQTPELTISDRLTTSVIDELIKDGSIKILPEGEAESLLRGSLTSYQRTAYQFDESDRVQRYKVTMVFELELTRRADQSLIWRVTATQDGIYEADTQTETDGQNLAIAALAQTIVTKTTRSW